MITKKILSIAYILAFLTTLVCIDFYFLYVIIGISFIILFALAIHHLIDG